MLIIHYINNMWRKKINLQEFGKQFTEFTSSHTESAFRYALNHQGRRTEEDTQHLIN